MEFSLRNIANQIDTIEQFADDNTPLIQNEDVTRLQDKMQHHVSDTAAELMTGLHKRSEQLEYMRAYESYRHLQGIVAADLAEKMYQEHGDTGSAKQAVFGYLQQSKRQMVTLDYQKRLEKSRLERSKQWLAHHRKTRFVGTAAVSGATSSGLFMAGDHMTPMLEFTRTQSTGVVGIGALILMLTMRSALRSGPTKAGEALSKQFNSTIKTYHVDRKKIRREEGAQALENLPVRYAEKHLAIPFGAAAMYLTNYDLSDINADNAPQRLQSMVDGALDITEESMLDSYGINPAKLAKKPWYKRLT